MVPIFNLLITFLKKGLPNCKNAKNTTYNMKFSILNTGIILINHLIGDSEFTSAVHPEANVHIII